MSEFSIHVNNVNQYTEDLRDYSKDILQLQIRLRTATTKLALQTMAQPMIRKKLNQLNEDMFTEYLKMNRMNRTASNAVNTYVKTEKSLLGENTSIINGGIAVIGNIVYKISDFVDEKIFLKLLSGGAAVLCSGGADAAWKDLLTDGINISAAVAAVSGAVSGKIFGYDYDMSYSGDLLGGSIKTESDSEFDLESGNVYAESEITVEGHLASGSVEGSLGLLSGSATGTIGTAAVTGTVSASLFKDGEFNPELKAEIKGEAAVAKGSAQTSYGTDENNVHANAEGTLLGAEADASVKAGKITSTDANGNTKTEYGVEASAGAEVYIAEGEVSGGFTLFGIEINASVSGKLGGAGVSAGGKVTTSGVSGKIGAGLGLGAGIELSIDWSNFSLW